MNVAIPSPTNGKFDAGYGFDSSGHFIQQNEPRVVIDAILKLVEKAQQQ